MDEEEGNRHRHGQALVAETTADADAALRGARGLYEKLRSGAVKDGMAREKISEPVHVFELELEIRGESVTHFSSKFSIIVLIDMIGF